MTISERSYLGAKYWDCPNDGAKFKCGDCGEYDTYNNMYLIQTPNGKRDVLHKDCIDPDWLNKAEYKGKFELR